MQSPSPQFSLRSLFKLTAFVAIVLTMAIVGRDTERIDALHPFSTLVALLPIAAVGAASWWRFASPRALAACAIVLFGLALWLPAIAWYNPEMETIRVGMGFHVWLVSFLGVAAGFINVFTGNDLGNALWWLIICTMGAASNVAFLVGYVGFLLGFKQARRWRVIRRVAFVGTILAVAVLPPLYCDGQFEDIYPGYGLWVASLLALWLGTRPD